MNLIGNKWLFRLKRNLDGSIRRYKARLKAKGFHQAAGVDYTDTFSLAPRAWFDKLKGTLLQWDFKHSKVDSSLFLLHYDVGCIWLLLYVDDILITGSSLCLINKFVFQLNKTFSLKDLGSVFYFLGIEVIRDVNGMHLSQTRYIEDLLQRIGMADCSISPTPTSIGIQLNKTVGSAFKNVFMYRSTIGALQYLTLTRPELAFIVNKLIQFMHVPTDMHWSACKRVLRYLQGTKTFGLQIRPSCDITISGYIDADWASNVDDRRSIGNYCIFLGQNLVSWSSRKQHVVAYSSTESEYRSLANGAAEVLWLQSLLNELQVELNRVPVIWCDNVGVGYLAKNPLHHQRTKHIEIDVHFVCDTVIQKKLEVRYVPSSEQIADVLTKVLPSSQFLLLQSKLNLKASPFCLRGNDKIS
nr:uncharacterized mitochondrial protein AtMg00810-like [Ziziphus jujuba var. spinosa]